MHHDSLFFDSVIEQYSNGLVTASQLAVSIPEPEFVKRAAEIRLAMLARRTRYELESRNNRRNTI